MPCHVPPLFLSIANFLAYTLNVALVNTAVLFPGAKGNREISEMYPTIITPATWAFPIWALIYALELFFILYQFIPSVSEGPMLHRAVRGFWILSSILQIGWQFAFVYNVIWVTPILIIFLWASLCAINVGIAQVRCEGPQKESLSDYLFIQIPFALHWGWVTIATVANFNLFCVSVAPKEYEYHIELAILAYVAMGSWLSLTVSKIPLAAIWTSSVAVWGLAAIASEQKKFNPALNYIPYFVMHGFYMVSIVMATVAAISACACMVAVCLERSYGVTFVSRTSRATPSAPHDRLPQDIEEY